MHYPIDDSTALLHDGKFTDGDPLTALPPSPNRAAYTNAVYDELLAVITAAQITPDAQALQLLSAIQTLIDNAVASSSNDDGIGEIRFGPFIDAPVGWLFFEGDDYYLRSEFSLLWAYITSFYKVVDDGDRDLFPGAFTDGNGTTTFRMPKMPDLFVRGAGGENAGELGALQESMNKSHSHRTRLARTSDSGDDGSQADQAAVANNFDGGGAISPNVTYPTEETGGIESRPTNVAWRYIIRAK